MPRALLLAVLMASAMLLSACGGGSQPTAADLSACGLVNNMVSGVFVTDLHSEQETSATELVTQARKAQNPRLVAAAEQLQAATTAESEVRINAALASLGAACTAMGVGPSNGGI